MRRTQSSLCRTFAAVMVAAAVSGACASGGANGGMAAMSQAEMQDHMRAMAVMDAADRAEIAEAQLALSRTSNAEVRRYAQMMVTEHTAAMQNRRSSMQAMGMTMGAASADATVRTLESSHAQAMQRLSPLSGMAFDRAYMQRQVEAHSSVLQALGATLPEGTMAMGTPARSNAPAGGITPASGGPAVPLSCDPGLSPAGPGSGRTEAGVGTADNQQPRGNCNTPADRPPLHGAHAEKGTAHAMGMNDMHRMAVTMVSNHLQMARDMTGRM